MEVEIETISSDTVISSSQEVATVAPDSSQISVTALASVVETVSAADGVAVENSFSDNQGNIPDQRADATRGLSGKRTSFVERTREISNVARTGGDEADDDDINAATTVESHSSPTSSSVEVINDANEPAVSIVDTKESLIPVSASYEDSESGVNKAADKLQKSAEEQTNVSGGPNEIISDFFTADMVPITNEISILPTSGMKDPYELLESTTNSDLIVTPVVLTVPESNQKDEQHDATSPQEQKKKKKVDSRVDKERIRDERVERGIKHAQDVNKRAQRHLRENKIKPKSKLQQHHGVSDVENGEAEKVPSIPSLGISAFGNSVQPAPRRRRFRSRSETVIPSEATAAAVAAHDDESNSSWEDDEYSPQKEQGHQQKQRQHRLPRRVNSNGLKLPPIEGDTPRRPMRHRRASGGDEDGKRHRKPLYLRMMEKARLENLEIEKQRREEYAKQRKARARGNVSLAELRTHMANHDQLMRAKLKEGRKNLAAQAAAHARAYRKKLHLHQSLSPSSITEGSSSPPSPHRRDPFHSHRKIKKKTRLPPIDTKEENNVIASPTKNNSPPPRTKFQVELLRKYGLLDDKDLCLSPCASKTFDDANKAQKSHSKELMEKARDNDRKKWDAIVKHDKPEVEVSSTPGKYHTHDEKEKSSKKSMNSPVHHQLSPHSSNHHFGSLSAAAHASASSVDGNTLEVVGVSVSTSENDVEVHNNINDDELSKKTLSEEQPEQNSSRIHSSAEQLDAVVEDSQEEHPPPSPLPELSEYELSNYCSKEWMKALSDFSIIGNDELSCRLQEDIKVGVDESLKSNSDVDVIALQNSVPLFMKPWL